MPIGQSGQDCSQCPVHRTPRFSHVCTLAWAALSLTVGSKASCTPVGISGTRMTAWRPSLFRLLLPLAAAGSGASLPVAPGIPSLGQGLQDPSLKPPTARAQGLYAGYLSLGTSSWMRK